MKRPYVIILGAVVLLAFIIGCRTVERSSPPVVGFEAIVRDFSKDRHRLISDLSQQLNLPLYSEPRFLDSMLR